MNQVAAGRWNRNFSPNHDFSGGEFLAIDIFGGVVVRAKRGTFQRHSNKDPTRALIAQNLRTHEGISVRGSVAAHRTRGDRSISTQLDLAAENGLRAAI